ncbi:DUF2004 domain-containing protein [Chitinophaga rhizophila]|uniref:DUF2004 domain-containing protein n=1 Tax=Chitinophaga rhizophila TaxID=2866212 RepID=A0ABS7GA18_9BACT|nr:DUF2004 domain-containing protein [Chitinophaga rhizophila]MBW8684489.1 DUF2004 domain-containing protein [Chitinophaga rhizophila]
MLYHFPYFGNINIAELKDYYQTKIILSGNPVSVDLNFNGPSIDLLLADSISTFLNNAAALGVRTNDYIKQDFVTRTGETLPYITEMLEHMDKKELLDLENNPIKKAYYRGFGFSNKPRYLLGKLKLIRIGLYPESSNQFAIFDYTYDIGGSPCNQLLVVRTDIGGTLQEVDWES